jgi:hypothetical protein
MRASTSRRRCDRGAGSCVCSSATAPACSTGEVARLAIVCIARLEGTRNRGSTDRARTARRAAGFAMRPFRRQFRLGRWR